MKAASMRWISAAAFTSARCTRPHLCIGVKLRLQLSLQRDAYRLYHITDKRGAATNHQATVAQSLPDAMAWAAQHLPPGRP